MGLGDTIEALMRYQRGWEAMARNAANFGGAFGGQAEAGADGRLLDIQDFGDDPGHLRMLAHVPAGLPAKAPLVVVLHGCGQTPGGYDRATGWSVLADSAGFALLMPEQRRANNPHTCFNWFQPEDVSTTGGELASILAMIAHMVAAHGLDPSRIFITGLSAGGAMTAALVARAPSVFAGAAIVAGLPYAGDMSVQAALEAMRQGHGLDGPELAARLRAAAPAGARWPALSVWQGTADTTVAPANADALLAQWQALLGLASAPGFAEVTGPQGHQVHHGVWRDAAGRAVLQSYRIEGLGHGTPIATEMEPRLGEAAPFVLDVGVPSTWMMARDWGLVG